MGLRSTIGRPFRAVPGLGGAVAKAQPPQVPKKGGGTQERDRNNDGSWREKRSDAGKKR